MDLIKYGNYIDIFMPKHVQQQKQIHRGGLSYIACSGFIFRPVTAKSQIFSSLIDQYLFIYLFFQFILSMIIWRYYEAKKHDKMFDGVGLPVSDKPSGDKIDDSSLEHFIDFTTSSHIIKDLPFGQKTL